MRLNAVLRPEQGCSGPEGRTTMPVRVPLQIHATTVLAVRHQGKVVMASDGQVTLGQTVVKHQARKVRRLYHDRVLAGFAGAAADGFALFSRFESKLEEHRGNLERAAVELARDWRTDRALRRLEAMMLVADARAMYLLSGTGDLIEPDDGVMGIGSGGPFAMAAARALVAHSTLDAAGDRRAGDGDRRRHLHLHEQPNRPGRALNMTPIATARDARLARRPSLTPREIVAELDKYVVGQAKAKRAVAIALRNRYRRQRLPADMAEEVAPKNILMIGPTGVGKTEIARRLARLAQSPFLKIEASKFTEVGYVGRDVESMVRDLVEIAVKMVREEREDEVRETARQAAEERLLDLLLPPSRAVAARRRVRPTRQMTREHSIDDARAAARAVARRPARHARRSRSKSRERVDAVVRADPGLVGRGDRRQPARHDAGDVSGPDAPPRSCRCPRRSST